MIEALANPDSATILSLGSSLGIGLLIGVERGWQQRGEAAGSRVAGVRTFGILGLLGGIAGIVPLPLAVIVLLAGCVVLLAGYVRQRSVTENISATTTLVGMLTLALGYLATTGNAVPATAIAVVAITLLSQREQLHGWLRGLSAAEVQSIGRFGLLAAVILPLLPDAQYGPLDAWSPRRIWMVVVLVCGFSLAGYVATKRLGAQAGLLVTAFTGALVSSTAVTWTLAQQLKAGKADLLGVTAGIAIASLVMLLRVLILTAILAIFAAAALARLLAPAIVVAMVLAALAWRRSIRAGAVGEARLGNPFDVRPALMLAALVAVIAVGVRWAQLHFGNAGIAATLALAGFADVDAAVIGLSTLPAGSISAHDAGLALAAPVLLNTALKGGMTIMACPDRRGVFAAAPLFLAVAAALVPALLFRSL